MPFTNITKEFKVIQQLSWKNIPPVLQERLEKYEKERVAYIDAIFQPEANGHILTNTNYSKINSADKVYANIWVGAVESALNVIRLRELGIGHVLNMALDEDYNDYNDVDDIHVTKIGIYDGHLAPVGVYHRAAKIIHDTISAGGNLLVHCSAGISRSATAVISYLILYKDMSFSSALTELQKHRFIISPHPLLIRSIIRDFESKFKW